ncbi:MAG: hypothetical protein IJ466_01505 [Clostridia bacterium]|nr:hypothetical protein [Clostridia bacterium]
MQPTLVLTAPHPGIISINGHFAGELSEAQPLIRPVSARGAIYLDYHPLDNSCRPLARRLVFSGGTILPESAEIAENMNIIIWPGNVSEVELAPDPWDISMQSFSRGGYNFILEGGAEPKLRCEGHFLSSLPEAAEPPEYHDFRNGAALLGACRDGMYLLTADRDFRISTGFLRAKSIEIGPDERIRALVPAGDPSGHATREIWQLSPAGLMLVSSEPTWLEGVPKYPQNAEETAISAIEAARCGRMEEAENYLAPNLRSRHPLEKIIESCDLCVELKYRMDSRPGVGLLRLEGGNFARVSALYFHTTASDDPRFPYQISAFESMEK